MAVNGVQLPSVRMAFGHEAGALPWGTGVANCVRSSLSRPASAGRPGAPGMPAAMISAARLSQTTFPFQIGTHISSSVRRTTRNSSSLLRRSGATHASTVSSDEKSQFMKAAKMGNLIPVFKRIFSDQLTPVLAYRCLVKEDQRGSPSFLFEAIEQRKESSHEGRFSSVGTQPAIEIIAKDNNLVILDHAMGTKEDKTVNDPLDEPGKIASNWKPVKMDGLPETFCGGWVGFFSYDTIRYVEKKKLPFDTAPEDDRDLPDFHLGLYRDVLVFDHVSKVLFAIHWVQLDHFETAEIAYNDGKVQLEVLVDKVQKAQRPRLPAGAMDLKIGQHAEVNQVSNMTEQAYKDKIVEAKTHILAGDISQIFLSQRFERRTLADPFEVYRALRVVNPSPYMIYLQTHEAVMVGASPEYLARTQKGKVIIRPLTGTKRRGKTSLVDNHLEQQLRGDAKEAAKHIMLVDLGRNDMEKVSKAGSVVVERLMDVECFSNVMHLSSTITGELSEEMSSWDALRATLPVGSVSGMPKVRAMKLIDELEPTRRGPYAGGIGHISFMGDMEIALALRTMVFPTLGSYNSSKNGDIPQEWLVYMQTGACVVADTDPALGHQECVNEATEMSMAINLAEATFVHN